MFQENNFNHEEITTLTLSEIVSRNYKAAAIFEKYKLDFCCKGNRPVKDACYTAGLDSQVVISDLNSLNMENAHNAMNPGSWDVSFLIDYIINTHHEYIKSMIPVISAHAEKVALVHGKNHPEVKSVDKIFSVVYKDLKQHMMKEEQILFPFIKRLQRVKTENIKFEAPYFGSVANPIRMMETEHQQAGDEMQSLRNITSGYRLPEDACNTFRILYQELKDFEEDLHKHVHLENYILFPKAAELEKELSQR